MTQKLRNGITIRTPEGVAFSLPLGGVATRGAACAVDLFCVMLMCNILNMIMNAFSSITPDAAQAVSILGFFVFSVGYGIFFEWYWNGQTIGKRLFKLRVVDAQGLQLNMAQIALRNLLRVIDCIPAFYMVGALVAIKSSRYQRLGDIAAQTIVTRVIKTKTPDLSNLLPDKYNSFRRYPILMSRLRKAVSPDMAAVILQSLLRREAMTADARVKVYAEFSDTLKAAVPFPQEATDGLSDERYLRNVTDILFNT